MKESEMILEVFNKILKTQYKDLNIPRNQLPEWDSMKHAELIIGLQKKLNVKFNVKDVVNIANATDLLEALKRTE